MAEPGAGSSESCRTRTCPAGSAAGSPLDPPWIPARSPPDPCWIPAVPSWAQSPHTHSQPQPPHRAARGKHQLYLKGLKVTRHLLTIILPSALTVIIVRSCGQGAAPHPPSGSEGGSARGSAGGARGCAGPHGGGSGGTRPVPPALPLPLPALALPLAAAGRAHGRAARLRSAPRTPRRGSAPPRTAPRSLRRAPRAI